MPRGGARVGAGRKPKEPKPAVVLGMDGVRLDSVAAPTAAAASSSTVDGLVKAPKDLTPKQREVWKTWAPRAIEQRTLVPATVAGFSELCEQMVLKNEIAAAIDKAGVSHYDSDRLLKRYAPLAQRVDASLARFKLTGFGKAADGAAKRSSASTASPWAKVAGK